MLAAGTAAASSGAALFMGPAVLAPAIREEFAIGLSSFGFLVASLWIGTILTLLPWGLLADRVGERLVLGLGLGTCGLLAISAGWASDFRVFVVLLFLGSTAGASVNAASGRAVMQWFRPEERGLALGVRQGAIPIGAAVGAVTLPHVEAAGGLEAAFGVLGGLCLVGALAAVIVVREAPIRDPELEGDAIPWTLRDGRLWTLSFGSGLYLFAQIALMSFTVLFLHDVHGMSEAAAAAVLAGFQMAAVATRIGAGRLSDRLGTRLRPLRWIGLASAVCIIATALVADHMVAVVAAILVAGAVSMSWNGLSLTAAAELAGRARAGAAIGFQQTSLSLIGVLVPVVFAALVQATSWQTAFGLSALGPLAGWLMLGTLRERV